MTVESNETYFEIEIDENFIANSLTAAMWTEGSIGDNEYITIEHIERDPDNFHHFIIIAKRNVQNVN